MSPTRRISPRLATGLAAALTILTFGPLGQVVSAQSGAAGAQPVDQKVEPQRLETKVDPSDQPRVSLPPRLAGLRGMVHMPRYRTSNLLQPVTWVPSRSDVVLDETTGAETDSRSGVRRAAFTGPRSPAAAASSTESFAGETLSPEGIRRTASSSTPAGAGAGVDNPDPIVSRPPVLRGTRGDIKRAAYAYTATYDSPGQPSGYGDPESRGKTVYGPGSGGGEIIDPGAGLDPEGWTILKKSPDTRVVYVSSSQGSDLNNGLSESTPVKTIAKGKSLVRMGYPDWLLLKRGDEWEESFGRWEVYGRSEEERIVVGAYGEGSRPLLKCGVGEGFSAIRSVMANVAFVDLDFWAHQREPGQPGFQPSEGTTGFFILGKAENVTIEGCRFRLFKNGLVLQAGSTGAPTNVRLRRNVIADSYNLSGHSQGLFALGTKDLLLEENLFDHNGWHPTIPGAEPTHFNHNVYSKGKSDLVAENLVARGNIFANASSFGLTASAEGHYSQQNPTIENNLFVRNGNGFVHGSGAEMGITNTTIRGNVLLEHGRSLKGVDQSFGILLGGTEGGLVANNLLAHKPDASPSHAIALTERGQSYKDITIRSNVMHGWNRGKIAVQSASLENVAIEDNLIVDPFGEDVLQYLESGSSAAYRGNRYQSSAQEDRWFRADGSYDDLAGWVAKTGAIDEQEWASSLPDPTRDVARYDSSVGGAGSVESFLSRAREMSKGNWDSSLTGGEAAAWIWEGFEPTR